MIQRCRFSYLYSDPLNRLYSLHSFTASFLMMRSLQFLVYCAAHAYLASLANAFVVPQPSAVAVTTPSSTILNVFGNRKNKNEDEDLSFIESRDMTREEMQRYNQASERIAQQEMWAMTIFSLILSIPMLYLVWVGFFAETVEFGQL